VIGNRHFSLSEARYNGNGAPGLSQDVFKETSSCFSKNFRQLLDSHKNASTKKAIDTIQMLFGFMTRYWVLFQFSFTLKGWQPSLKSPIYTFVEGKRVTLWILIKFSSFKGKILLLLDDFFVKPD